ncbi:hypothetical protein, partial [Tissierella sp.]|uniref:hypothetical protein n=1 Tax=Tissierella sp. TaxID=41274 RepID=UPI00285908C1
TVNSANLGFTAQVALPLDTNTIMVTSELDGRETEPSPAVTVIKDKVAPVLVVSEPLDNAKIKVESVHVIGNVVDNIELAKLEINGKVIVLDAEGNFHERLMLNPGANTITVKATDGAGNVTTVVRTVLVELEAPVITNIEPSEDMELEAGDVLTVSFNAPSGGNGYFRLVVPFGLQNNDLGIPMTEVEGLYTGTWTVPAEVEAENVQVEVVFVNAHGYEVTEMAEGRITIVLGDDPENPPAPARITNLMPATDEELYSGEALEISFNAPAGGSAYYRIMLPFGPMNTNPGNPMTEVSPGLYKATYTAHDGVVASNLQIEVIFVGADGTRLSQIAEGKLTLVGNMQALPVSSVIIGDEAFDMDYLNNNAYAQARLIEAYNNGEEIYTKLNENTIVTETGRKVTIDVLPEMVRYHNTQGITLYAK